MSKIPFSFTPIPKYFSKSGILNPQHKSYSKRLTFIYWTMSKCYSISSMQNGENYEAYEFSCSYDQISLETGLTIKEIRILFDFFINVELLIKFPSPIKNRQARFKWNADKFICEKIVPIHENVEALEEKRADQFQKENNTQNLQKGQTDLREKTDEKGQTNLTHKNNFEEEEKGRPNLKRAHQRADQGQTDLREKTDEKLEEKGRPNGTLYRNDRAIESSLYNSDNVAKPRARENSSLFCKGTITAFFNPRKYKLRDGQPLTLRTQNAFGKYSPSERERLLANVQFYEEYVDSGKPIKKSHEQFLQYCVNEDLAMKKENSLKNDLSARFMKEEYKMNEMEILGTVIKIKKNNLEEPISISKELPPRTFNNILDNYVNTYYPRLEHAT